MDDLRLGAAVRALRQRRGWTQAALGRRAGASRSTVGRIERGHVGSLSVDMVRRVAAALDARVDLVPRWRGGDLDRLLNRRHSALHEAVADWFGRQRPDWTLAPEVSFSIYGERGVIDVLGWHASRKALLVIELKTDVADVNELVGSADRKRRLAREVARERGWDAGVVGAWVIVASGRTNRRRLAAHRSMLRAAYPAGVHALRSWLAAPSGPVAALSMWPDAHPGGVGTSATPVRRLRGALGRPDGLGSRRGGPGVRPDGARGEPLAEAARRQRGAC